MQNDKLHRNNYHRQKKRITILEVKSNALKKKAARNRQNNTTIY